MTIITMVHDKKNFGDSKETIASRNEERLGYDNPIYQISGSQYIAHDNIFDQYQETEANCNDDKRREQLNITYRTKNQRKFSTCPQDSRSWWYKCCIKWRVKKTEPYWHLQHWSKYCPYPYCPTYRQCTRVIGLGSAGIFLWSVLYAILGTTAAPGGNLFQLIILTLCTYIGGYLLTLINMPALIGMLLTGILFQNIGLVHFDGDFDSIIKHLRKISLVVILIRAGLSLDPVALKKLKWTAIKLGLIPWASELPIVAVTTHYFLELPWLWAFLLGCIIAAVSPAVVVPCLLRLRLKGFGVAKGIPTLIIAAAGMDDAISVAAFGIMTSIIFSNDSLIIQILQGPLSIVCGIIFGVLWGIFSKYVPDKTDPFVVPLRIILLAIGGLFPIFVSDLIGYGGAGPLAVVSAAFVSLISWSSYKNNAWSNTRNPATVTFEVFWMVFEPILFGLTGAQVRIANLDGSIVAVACACIGISLFVRIVITMFVGMGCGLNLKEKIFIAITWMSKATVQAALGPVVLGIVGPDSPHTKDAENILTVCILSILLTAPAGAILITLLGPKLLTRTSDNDVIPTRKVSLHDISMAANTTIIGDVENHGSIEGEKVAGNVTLVQADILERTRM